MTVSSFDRFIDGLADAMASAQDACRRQRARLKRRQALGKVRPLALASLLPRNTIGPSRLCVELDCDLRLLPPSHAGGPQRVAVHVGRGRDAHRLRITLQGHDALQGEVVLDGALLRRFTAGTPVPAAAGDTP